MLRDVVEIVGVEAIEHFLAHDIGTLVSPVCLELLRG
jgi:hypothetical protein